MVLLDHKELSKYRNGKYRWQVFLDKIEEGDWFKHKNGVEIKIMPENFKEFKDLINSGVETGVFDRRLGRWKFEVITCVGNLSVGNLVRLRELLKTAEFGGKVTNAAEVTTRVERSVAEKLADRLGGTLSSKYYRKKVGLLNQIELDKEFKVEETVESLIKSKYLTSFRGATVHFRDKFVTEVKAAYKALAERDRFWKSAHFDKWNPADIWVTKGSVDVKKCKSLGELASTLCSSGSCVGISLKKAGTKPVFVNGFKENEESIKAGSIKVVGNYRPENTSIITLKVEGTQANGNPLSVGIRPMNGNFRLEVLEHAYRKGGCGRELFDEAGKATGFTTRGLTIRGIQNKIYNATLDPSQAEVLAKFLTEVSKYAQSKASGHCPFIVTY